MHPKPQVIVEFEEHLFADGAGIDHRVPVEEGRPLGETALRRRDGRLFSHEMPGELASDAVDGMALWHG